MRVTEGTTYGAIRDSIVRGRERMENLQTQNATLKKVNTPSDDPVGAAKVLAVRTDKANNDQFVQNGQLAQTFLNSTDHALESLVELVNRAKEIGISQSSAGSATEESRLGVSEEVSQLYQQAVAVSNTKVGDRYVFGGYKTNKPPIDAMGKYQGDEGQLMVEISKGVFLAMNVPGSEAFNTQPQAIRNRDGKEDTSETNEIKMTGRGPASLEGNGLSGENVNLFDELQNLRIGLLTGDQDTIRNTLDRFDQIHGTLVSTRAKIGSRIAGLESSNQAMERHNITNAQLTSSIEDADMSKVVSDLAREEQVYKSALASSQKLIQPTLLDFLK